MMMMMMMMMMIRNTQHPIRSSWSVVHISSSSLLQRLHLKRPRQTLHRNHRNTGQMHIRWCWSHTNARTTAAWRGFGVYLSGPLFQPVPAGAKQCWGGRKQTESTCDLVQAPFFSSSERLVKGIFVKIKPNCLSSGDIALASTLISTCLSTDELLLSGMSRWERSNHMRPNI